MNKLISSATFFEKSNHNTWSWAGNLENPKQLDHIVTRQFERKKIINCYTTELSGVDSDHHALTTTVRIAKFIPKKGTTKNQPPDEHILDKKTKRTQYNWSGIRRDAFNEAVAKRIKADPTATQDVSSLSEILQSACLETSEEEPRRRKPWFETSTELLLQKIAERDHTLQQYLRNKNDKGLKHA